MWGGSTYIFSCLECKTIHCNNFYSFICILWIIKDHLPIWFLLFWRYCPFFSFELILIFLLFHFSPVLLLLPLTVPYFLTVCVHECSHSPFRTFTFLSVYTPFLPPSVPYVFLPDYFKWYLDSLNCTFRSEIAKDPEEGADWIIGEFQYYFQNMWLFTLFES